MPVLVCGSLHTDLRCSCKAVESRMTRNSTENAKRGGLKYVGATLCGRPESMNHYPVHPEQVEGCFTQVLFALRQERRTLCAYPRPSTGSGRTGKIFAINYQLSTFNFQLSTKAHRGDLCGRPQTTNHYPVHPEQVEGCFTQVFGKKNERFVHIRVLQPAQDERGKCHYQLSTINYQLSTYNFTLTTLN